VRTTEVTIATDLYKTRDAQGIYINLHSFQFALSTTTGQERGEMYLIGAKAE
jgi:hypothetical protein